MRIWFVSRGGCLGVGRRARQPGSARTPDDGGVDGTVTDASGCPQYDLTQDPKHCGSCTHACSSVKCARGCVQEPVRHADHQVRRPDGGFVCADLKTDTLHCGQCPTLARRPTPAGSKPGTGNPDAGIPFDGGSGWSLGTPTCEAGACATQCSSGTSACSDGICYDLQNFHDHCGGCNTACAAGTEWCNYGHCCALGQMYCGGSCIDVLTQRRQLRRVRQGVLRRHAALLSRACARRRARPRERARRSTRCRRTRRAGVGTATRARRARTSGRRPTASRTRTPTRTSSAAARRRA